MSKDKRFFVVHSGGYDWTGSSKALMVADSATVRVEDVLNFKNGRKVSQGKILFISVDEGEADAFVKKLTRSKPATAGNNTSFHEDQPRKAAVAQRSLMSSLLNKPPASSGTTVPSKKKKMHKKTKENQERKRHAQLLMEIEGNDGSARKAEEEVSPQSDSEDSSSDSDASSLAKEPRETVNRAKAADMNLLRGLDLERDSDPTNEEFGISRSTTLADFSEEKKKKENGDKGTTITKKPGDSVNGMKDMQAMNGSKSVQDISMANEKEHSSPGHTQFITTVKKSKRDSSSEDSQPEEKKLKSKGDSSSEDYSESRKKNKKKVMSKKVSLSEDSDSEIKEGKAKKSKLDWGQDMKKSVKKLKRSKREPSDKISFSDSEEEKKDKSKVDSSSEDSEPKKKIVKREKSKYDSDDSITMAEENQKKSKKMKKSAKMKHQPRKKSKSRKPSRNATIYEGQNYCCSSTTKNAVKLHDDYNVYVLNRDLDNLSKSKTASIFLRQMIDKVYTLEALKAATPQGFPARGKGRKFYKEKEVTPRLHPDGIDAFVAKALALEVDSKNWRPKMAVIQMKGVLSNKICGFKKTLSNADSSD